MLGEFPCLDATLQQKSTRATLTWFKTKIFAL